MNFSALRRYGPHHNTEPLQLGLTSCSGNKYDGLKKTYFHLRQIFRQTDRQTQRFEVVLTSDVILC